MLFPKCLWSGLAALAAVAVARAQTVSLPGGPPAPLVSAGEVRPAPAELLLQQQAAQHALELGLPSLAAEIYRGLLAVPGGDRNALGLSLATALLDDGRVDEAEQALQGIVTGRDSAWHLRAGLIATVRKSFEVAKAEAAVVKPEQLGAADRGWFYFLQGQLADAAGDAQQAQTLYDQAAGAAVSDQQRAQFALAKSEAELRAGAPNDSLVGELQRNVDKYQGTLTGYRYARQYAVALDAIGRKIDAVALLQRQLLALPPEARATTDDFRLLLGFIAGPETEPGRRALTELLRNGSDRAKQRIALQLLGRAAAQPGAERDAFRRLLDELIGAPQPHPILEDLLLFRAQVNLADKNYALALGDAQMLLEKFPGSPLKPAALGVQLGVAWEQRRYRLAADYASQARAALPPGEAHAQLGVLVAEAGFRAGDFGNAADAYAAALNERPAGIDAGALIFQRVQAEIQAGRLDSAQTLIDQMTKDSAFDTVNRWQAEWNLARALEAHEQTAVALVRVGRLLGESGAAALPAALRVRMAWLQARLAFEAGQSEQALKLAGALADSLAGAGGTDIPAELKTQVISSERLQEAEADFKLQRTDAALGLLKKLRDDFPQSDATVYSYIIEAKFHADNNDLVDAQALLTKLADDFPASDYAPYALYLAALNAERREQDANLEEANRIIERLVSKYPQNDLVFYARLKQGDLFRKLNRFGPAQQAYEYLVNNYAQHPDALVARMALAACHSAQATNDPAHAESAAAIYESLQDRPDAPVELRVEAGCRLGLLQVQRGKPDDARTTWWRLVDEFLRDGTKAAELGATGRYWMSRALLELGNSLEQQQKLEQAREAWLLIGRYQLPGEALAQARLARYLPPEAKP
ncbi:MAG TPA: tetratricopeptide repeat protein [Opitutaceae bacterium]|jgi:outer membrane protein assembly factor BamD (BamD/ComL family)|nr:tetratricopeptide repeat protein [Opitutaceae bacterium]